MKRTYDYLFEKRYYPEERGYRYQRVKLPSWISISVDEKGDSRCLTVHSRIHINKEVEMRPEYSKSAFTDEDIIKDLSGEIFRRFIA